MIMIDDETMFMNKVYIPILLLFRYLAICRPLSPLSRSSMGKAKKIILLIWIISFLSALPWALFTKVCIEST